MNILSNEEKLLLEIEKHIVNGDVSHLSTDTEDWGGADVVIHCVMDENDRRWIQKSADGYKYAAA
jgi:hypothetical protein